MSEKLKKNTATCTKLVCICQIPFSNFQFFLKWLFYCLFSFFFRYLLMNKTVANYLLCLISKYSVILLYIIIIIHYIYWKFYLNLHKHGLLVFLDADLFHQSFVLESHLKYEQLAIILAYSLYLYKQFIFIFSYSLYLYFPTVYIYIFLPHPCLNKWVNLFS